MDPVLRTPPLGFGGSPSSTPFAAVPVTVPPAVEAIDPVGEFMQGSLHPPVLPLRAEDVPQSFDGMRQLANNWCWREVVRLCEHCILNTPNLPHQRIQWRFAQAFALTKMNLPNEAAELLERHVLRFTPEQNRYETYANVYPGKKGSMVNFALHLLFARLPLLKQEPQQAQARLYELLDFCQQQRLQATVEGAPSDSVHSGLPTLEEGLASENGDTIASWRARERRVKVELVNTHTLLNQHTCAVDALNDILAEYTPEMRRRTPNGQVEYIDLLQRLGNMHLEAGQMGPAEDAFSRVEAIDESTLSSEEAALLAAAQAINRGTLCVAQQQYARGFEEFAGVLAQALTEPVVFNLCSMYDLQSEQGAQKKKVLQAVVQRYKGDFFPAKYLRQE
eukprot:GGOE01000407.1.p1 GENE.GGOE01000407.1~~GGOE01000407.1.p1  ORF type:complete len:392 (-),score=100.59 GGOE01000407.1:111-1286(-)